MAKNIRNPFIIRGYESKKYFCDREEELKILLSEVENHADVTLISDRRMGKTGLIYRLFEEIDDRKMPVITINVDIYSSRSLAEFVKLFSEAIMRSYPEKTPFGKKFIAFIKRLRPQISFDSITGEPQIMIAYQNDDEKEQTLRNLLDFLENQPSRVLVAIDEFQQIREYPERNVEAVLRTYIQPLKNVNFIFCGSRKHIMADIFSDARSPFYSSTRFLWLDKITPESYSGFIVGQFESFDRKISQEAVDFILMWTRRHTFYTQSLCHTLFASGVKNIGPDDVKKSCSEILKANEPVYLQYRALLSAKQWDYLIAIAKEEEVQQTQSQVFLRKYRIGSPSTSQRLAESLLKKEMIVANITKDTETLRVYDVFLMHWLQTEF